MFLYSGNLPLLYSGNPKIKRGLLKSAKKKSPVNLAIYRTLLRRERDFIPLYQLP